MRNGNFSLEQECVDFARKTLQKILDEEFGGRGVIAVVEQATDLVEGRVPTAAVLHLRGQYRGESLNVYVLEDGKFLVARIAISVEKEILKARSDRHDLYSELIEIVEKMG